MIDAIMNMLSSFCKGEAVVLLPVCDKNDDTTLVWGMTDKRNERLDSIPFESDIKFMSTFRHCRVCSGQKLSIQRRGFTPSWPERLYCR
jgi:hypothetical protein